MKNKKGLSFSILAFLTTLIISRSGVKIPPILVSILGGGMAIGLISIYAIRKYKSKSPSNLPIYDKIGFCLVIIFFILMFFMPIVSREKALVIVIFVIIDAIGVIIIGKKSQEMKRNKND